MRTAASLSPCYHLHWSCARTCAHDYLRAHGARACAHDFPPISEVVTLLFQHSLIHPYHIESESNNLANNHLHIIPNPNSISHQIPTPYHFKSKPNSKSKPNLFCQQSQLSTDDPYDIQNPEDFFKDDFYNYGFNPEVGSVGMPVAATIRAIMPPEGWEIPVFSKQPDGYIKEIPNPTWEYHKYIPYSNPGKVHDQIELYGHAKNLDDFCENVSCKDDEFYLGKIKRCGYIQLSSTIYISDN